MARLRIILETFVLSIVGCCCLSISMAQDRATSPGTTRPTQVIVTITDTPGRYVGGLHKDQVTMLDNGVPQEVLTIEDSTFPVSIGLLFNVSRTSYHDLLELARRTTPQFFAGPQNTIAYLVM